MVLNINGVELDFDFTSPEDLHRYHTASEQLSEALPSIEELSGIAVSDEPEDVEEYIETLQSVLRSFATFLDEMFGEGVADKLLGDNPRLDKVAEIQNAIAAAAEKQDKGMQARLAKYAPNRATGQAS